MRETRPKASHVTALRRLVRRHHRIATLLIVAALALKLIVPAGFMPIAARDGTITVLMCTGTGPATIEMAIPGLPPVRHDIPAPAKADAPCAFAGLAMPIMAGADPLLLAAAIAFVMAMAIGAVTALPYRVPARLRPPLRAPPHPA